MRHIERNLPLLPDTRGGASHEHVAILAVLALAGVGSFTAYGGAARQAIAGSTTDATVPTFGAAVAREAAEGDAPPFNAADPLGVQAMSKADLDGLYQELNAAEDELMAQLEGVDPNTIPEEQLMELEAYFGAIDGQRAEVYSELIHKDHDEKYAAQGAADEQTVLMSLINDFTHSSEQLDAAIVAWEQANGRPCVDQASGSIDEGCAADQGINMLLSVNSAQEQDIQRRMFEMGIEFDENGGLIQLTDEQGRPLVRHWQGTWSLQGFVMGPDGALLADESGNPYIFTPGVNPELAISGEVKPIGVLDAATGEARELSSQGSEGGFFSFLKNTGIGILKEGWDMALGLFVGAKNVLWDFGVKDLIGDIVGLQWTFPDTREAIGNFATKFFPTAWNGIKGFFGQGWECINPGNGLVADARGQACGRSVLAIGSLFVPFTKVGSAGKAASVAGKAGSVASKGGRFASILERGSGLLAKLPGRGLVEAAGTRLGALREAFRARFPQTARASTVTDDAARIAERDALLAEAQRKMAAGEAGAEELFQKAAALDDAGRAGAATTVGGIPRNGTPGQGPLRERWRNHREWKNATERALGEQWTAFMQSRFGTKGTIKRPHLWQSMGRAFRYTGNPLTYVGGLPFRLGKGLWNRMAIEGPNYIRMKAGLMGGYQPQRLGRWLWNNRDYTGPAGIAGGAYNHGAGVTEGIEQRFVASMAQQAPAP